MRSILIWKSLEQCTHVWHCIFLRLASCSLVLLQTCDIGVHRSQGPSGQPVSGLHGPGQEISRRILQSFVACINNNLGKADFVSCVCGK